MAYSTIWKLKREAQVDDCKACAERDQSYGELDISLSVRRQKRKNVVRVQGRKKYSTRKH